MKTDSQAIPADSDRTLRLERLLEEVIRRRSTGDPFDDEKIIEENPQLMPELAEHLRQLSMVEEAERCAQSEALSESGLSDRSGVPGACSASIRSDSIPGCETLEEIYRGGQGVVYRARHRATGRDVAIKVLRDGPFQGPHDRTRFDREVRVLAQLKHPNIVTIHDSGTASGSQYFVMDYIEGQPLDAFMAPKRQSVKATLRLFQKICSAVNEAHVRGIIHRDLKPGNIRIDERGEPHILDFGLAKIVTAENEGSTDQQTMTLTGQFVGSLHWASPEQAQGVPDRIDLRTDVYSLGLILYHMLTNEFPYVVTGNTQSVLRNIIETEPAHPDSIRTDIDDEINTIVLKCLAKESELRYQTAGAVADDVERYLTNQPILARAPSAMYQLRKLAVRHKLPAALIALLLVLVSGFAVWMSVLYTRASQAEERAVTEAKTATAVRDFLVTDMLASAQPEVAQGSNLTVEEVLASASERIEEAFADQPLIEAAIRVAIGQSYVSLGHFDSAELHLRAADTILARQLGDEHEDTLRARTKMIDLLYRQGDFAEAASVSLSTLETCRSVLGEEHEVTLEAAYQWARLLWVQGKLSASQELQRHTLEVRRRVLGDEHPDTLVSLNQWGLEGLVHNADMAEAEDLFREALDISRRTLGEAYPETLKAMANLGFVLTLKRELPEAEALLNKVFDAHQRILGSKHPATLLCTIRMGLLRKEQDRIDEAEELSRKALETSRQTLGEDHPVTQGVLRIYGTILLRHGKSIAGAEIFRDMVWAESRPGVIREESGMQALDCLSVALTRMGRYAEAEQGHRTAMQEQRRLAKSHPMTNPWTLRCLVHVLAVQGKKDEARPLSVELLELRRIVAEAPNADAYQLNCYARELLTVYPTDLRNPKRGLEVALQAFELSSDAYHYNRYTLALAYEMNGDLDHAIEFSRRALSYIPVEYSRERAEYEEALVRMLEESEDDIAAQAVYRDTLAQRRDQFSEGHLDIAESLVRLGETLIRHGKFDEAEEHLREAVEIRENALDEGDWHIGEAISLLGASLAGQERAAEAEPLLVDGFTVLVDSPMAYSNQTGQALQRIENFLRNMDRSEEFADYVAMLPDPMGLAASVVP